MGVSSHACNAYTVALTIKTNAWIYLYCVCVSDNVHVPKSFLSRSNGSDCHLIAASSQ